MLGESCSYFHILRVCSPTPTPPRPALPFCPGEVQGPHYWVLQLVRDKASSSAIIISGSASLLKTGSEGDGHIFLSLSHATTWQINVWVRSPMLSWHMTHLCNFQLHSQGLQVNMPPRYLPNYLYHSTTDSQFYYQPRCPPSGKWVKKKWYVCTRALYSVI